MAEGDIARTIEISDFDHPLVVFTTLPEKLKGIEDLGMFSNFFLTHLGGYLFKENMDRFKNSRNSTFLN